MLIANGKVVREGEEIEPGLKVEVIDEVAMEKLGLNLFLAVGSLCRASARK